MNVNLTHFTRLFPCNTVQAYVDESIRTKLRDVGVYAIACDGMPPVSGKQDIVAYVVSGNVGQRILLYGYHLEKREKCVRPHRDVHRMVAERSHPDVRSRSTFAGLRTVKRNPKSGA